MRDALFVGLLESFADLDRDIERLFHLERTFFDLFANGRSVDESHGHEGLAIRLFDVVDRGDIGMIEQRGRLRFSKEAGFFVFVPQRGGGKKLESNDAA